MNNNINVIMIKTEWRYAPGGPWGLYFYIAGGWKMAGLKRVVFTGAGSGYASNVASCSASPASRVGYD